MSAGAAGRGSEAQAPAATAPAAGSGADRASTGVPALTGRRGLRATTPACGPMTARPGGSPRRAGATKGPAILGSHARCPLAEPGRPSAARRREGGT